MHGPATSARTRRLHGDGGFTLVEALAVMIILVILAGTAAPVLSTMSETRSAMAASHLLRDVTFARQHAIATGSITWVRFDTTGNTSWAIQVEDPTTPGKATALPLRDAATGGDHQQDLNTGSFADVTIVSAAFTGTDTFTVPDIGFDWLGRPLTNDAIFLSALGAVTLTGGHVVNVHVETGFAEHVAP